MPEISYGDHESNNKKTMIYVESNSNNGPYLVLESGA